MTETAATVEGTPPTPKNAAALKPLNLFIGIPDDQMAKVAVGNQSRGVFIGIPGTASVLPYIATNIFAVNILYLGGDQGKTEFRLASAPILNHTADPDRCVKALVRTQNVVNQAKQPCFNHPAAVARTTRDGVATLLAGIPDADVPKTIRLIAKGPNSIRDAAKAAEIAYPFLLRVAGDHGGVSTIKVENEAQLEVVNEMNCYGRTMYLTEFRDYRSADGRYRKFRIAVVGNMIFLRHMIVGDTWMLHAGKRGANTEAEESEMLAGFDKDLGQRALPALTEIVRRIGLDYFGIDCHITPEGKVLVFEVNACMNIMDNTSASPNMWDRPIAQIRAAFNDLLAHPERWRFQFAKQPAS